MKKLHAAITAVHGYVPDYVLTNKELETIVDTTDEWITSRTGIKERRILKGDRLGTSDMAVPAVNGLLKKRGISALDIDLIIFSTTTPDFPFPATANILADKIGAKNAWSFDLQAACSGFLFALATGAQFIESGKHQKVLVVGGDKMSSIINYQDRATCVIFGDGCGCALLEPNYDGFGLLDVILKSDGSGGKHLNMLAGGSVNPASHQTVDQKLHYVFQEGQAVFKFAVTNMADISVEIMERNSLEANDVSWFVPHQANKRIIDAVSNRMGVGSDKVMTNIERYGNTTNATLPLLLWEYENLLKKGDNLIFATFGGGFTWGSAYLKWAYNSVKKALF